MVNRAVGGQKFKFKDFLKSNMTGGGMTTDNWERLVERMAILGKHV